MRTRTYREKGAKVAGSILELFNAGLPPFDRHDAVLPQDPAHMPPSLTYGSVDHRMFLFVINYYMRGGIDSNTAVKLVSLVYELRPQYFDAYWVAANLTEEELREVLISVGLNYSKSRVPEFWIENARRLVERYDGDPGNIFDGVSTYQEACRRIQNDHRGGGFKGFQKKMVSMIVYFFMDADFINPFNFPIPVDIHVARITLCNKIVTVPGVPSGENVLKIVKNKEVVLDAIRDFYIWYSLKYQVDPLDLCNAIWMYSRLRCSDNPENEWAEERSDKENRGRKIWKVKPDWSDPATYNRWRRSCGVCPITETCVLNGASKPYYVRGEFKLDDPRNGPPRHIIDAMGLDQRALDLNDSRSGRSLSVGQRLEILLEAASASKDVTVTEVQTEAAANFPQQLTIIDPD